MFTTISPSLIGDDTGKDIVPATFSPSRLNSPINGGIFRRTVDNGSKRCQITSYNDSKRVRTHNSFKVSSPIFIIDKSSIKYFNGEGRTFSIRLSVSLVPENGDLKREECPNLDQFMRQNLERENLIKTIQDCISQSQSGSCTLIDMGGTYVLGEYKSEKEMHCVWKFPKEGCYAIETDASFKDKEKAGSSAFLIRDCTGRVVYAQRCISQNYSSSVGYEASGVLNGVKQARIMDFKRVEVRSDCKSLIEAINGTYNVPENAKSIVEFIIEEKKNFESIEFHFVPRGVNRAADWLSHFRDDEVGAKEEWVLPDGEGLRVLNASGKELPKPVIDHCEEDEKGSPQKKQKKNKCRS